MVFKAFGFWELYNIAVIISYTLEKTAPHERTALHRILYGYNDKSNNGAYNYKREGIIRKRGILKLNGGVIIVSENHKREILSTLKKNKATRQLKNLNQKPREKLNRK